MSVGALAFFHASLDVCRRDANAPSTVLVWEKVDGSAPSGAIAKPFALGATNMFLYILFFQKSLILSGMKN